MIWWSLWCVMSYHYILLNRWGRVTHIWVSKLSYHWFRWWLVACSASSHYVNQCSLQDNKFENVSKMAVIFLLGLILLRPDKHPRHILQILSICFEVKIICLPTSPIIGRDHVCVDGIHAIISTIGGIYAFCKCNFIYLHIKQNYCCVSKQC